MNNEKPKVCPKCCAAAVSAGVCTAGSLCQTCAALTFGFWANKADITPGPKS